MAPFPTSFRLLDKTVTPERNIVAGPDGEATIEPKIMQVLCVLASKPGQVFGRAELIDEVWGTEYGADESLTRAVSLLRKALGDTRSEPSIIETIAKRGYRLLPSALAPQPPPGRELGIASRPSRRAWIAAACVTASAAFALPWWLMSGRPDGIPVTVLPVNAIGKETSQTGLAAALTVDLVGLLAREKRFHVTAGSPDPATRGRRYSIYADLQTGGNRIRIHAEIMDSDTDQALWSRLYERSYDGKLSTQSSLSATISRDLTVALLSLANVAR